MRRPVEGRIPSRNNLNRSTLSFKNALKAEMTQCFTKLILEWGGYDAQHSGVEKLIPGIRRLSRDRYLALEIPPALRRFPDLLSVTSKTTDAAYLVEVKYRRSLNEQSVEGLWRELVTQNEYWPTTYTVLMISEPFHRNGTFHEDYMRVIPPEKLYLLSGDYAPAQIWGQLLSLPTVFPELKHVPCRHLDLVASKVRDLGKA
jgi:hypothetical protein